MKINALSKTRWFWKRLFENPMQYALTNAAQICRCW